MSEKLEAGAISKLKQWEREQEAEKQKRKDALIKQLRVAIVERGLFPWIKSLGDFAIEYLVRCGKVECYYNRHYNDGEDVVHYGCVTLDEFEGRCLNNLRTAWKDVVQINSERIAFEQCPSAPYLHVTFAAI